MIVQDTGDWGPRRLGASTRAVDPVQRYSPLPAPSILKTILTPKQRAQDKVLIAAREATHLQTVWEARQDAQPGTGTDMLYTQLRYAQGRADMAQEMYDITYGEQS